MNRKLSILIMLLVFVCCLPGQAAIDKAEVRKSLDQFSSFAYAIDPTYKIDSEDIKIAKSNPNTKFALGLALNSTFKISDSEKKYLRERPNTFFSYALSQNSNYKISQDDRNYVKTNPSTLLTFGLTRNPSFKTAKTKSETSSVETGDSYFLFIRNFQNWLAQKGISIPGPIVGVYNFVVGIIKMPFSFLQSNFELFDFLDKPILEWSGWTILHALITMSLLSIFTAILFPRPRPPQQ